MCRPAVIYGGFAGRPPADNALAVESLKFLSMGHPDRPALERFRQWIELWRGRAEGKFQQALARTERGDRSAADFASAEAERDQVLVNYQHGMRRYLEMVRAGGPEQLEMALATPLSARAAVHLMPRAAAPRRKANRSQRAARQKAVAANDVQQRALRVAVTTAKVCTGNWVNAACAVP